MVNEIFGKSKLCFKEHASCVKLLASAKLLEMNENRDQLLSFVRSAICGSRDWEGRTNASAKSASASDDVAESRQSQENCALSQSVSVSKEPGGGNSRAGMSFARMSQSPSQRQPGGGKENWAPREEKFPPPDCFGLFARTPQVL